MTARHMATVLLLCAACARGPGGDPDLFGVSLEVRADAAPYASASDAHQRLRRILSESSRYYGFDPSPLYGLNLVIGGEPVMCGGMWTWGCERGDTNTIEIVTLGVPCLEATTITHELLHYFIGDPGHIDPRWHNIGPLFEELTAACH